MTLVNLGAIWTQDDVAKWRPTFVLTTSWCFRMNKYIINHFLFLKALRSLIRFLFEVETEVYAILVYGDLKVLQIGINWKKD